MWIEVINESTEMRMSGWVLHEQSIPDDILSRLDVSVCDVKRYRLFAERILMYDIINTIKIDVSDISPEEAAARIIELGLKR